MTVPRVISRPGNLGAKSREEGSRGVRLAKSLPRAINRRLTTPPSARFAPTRAGVGKKKAKTSREHLNSFPLFSSWPSAAGIVLSNTEVRLEIYWRFISGFRPIRSNLGRSGQIVHYMQIVQSRINTGDFASR
jgi:hypothetical protein